MASGGRYGCRVLGLRIPQGPLRVLALGAHPDDIEIGCGGTLLRLCSSRQVRAQVIVLTGSPERQTEAHEAASQFFPGCPVDVRTHDLPDGRLPSRWDDVKSILEEAARGPVPDIILTPRVDDAHQDHRLLAGLTSTSWRDSLILHYEIPKWDGDLGRTTHYVPLDRTVVSRKVELLSACFPSQVTRDWWDAEMFLGLMRLRGMECRGPYAEGFIASKAIVEM